METSPAAVPLCPGSRAPFPISGPGLSVGAGAPAPAIPLYARQVISSKRFSHVFLYFTPGCCFRTFVAGSHVFLPLFVFPLAFPFSPESFLGEFGF